MRTILHENEDFLSHPIVLSWKLLSLSLSLFIFFLFFFLFQESCGKKKVLCLAGSWQPKQFCGAAESWDRFHLCFWHCIYYVQLPQGLRTHPGFSAHCLSGGKSQISAEPWFSWFLPYIPSHTPEPSVIRGMPFPRSGLCPYCTPVPAGHQNSPVWE